MAKKIEIPDVVQILQDGGSIVAVETITSSKRKYSVLQYTGKKQPHKIVGYISESQFRELVRGGLVDRLPVRHKTSRGRSLAWFEMHKEEV